jgi:hypothetical protein
VSAAVRVAVALRERIAVGRAQSNAHPGTDARTDPGANAAADAVVDTGGAIRRAGGKSAA